MAFTPPLNSGSANSTGVATLATALGATAVSGNLLVASIVTNATADPTFVTPTGWTQLGSTVVNASGICIARYYKVSAGTETGVTFNWTGNARCAGIIAQYVIASPTLDSPVSGTGSGTALAGAAFSISGGAATSQTHELEVFWVGHQRASTNAITPANGFTDELDAASAGSGTTITSIHLLDKDSVATNTPAPGMTNNSAGTTVWAAAVDTFYSASGVTDTISVATTGTSAPSFKLGQIRPLAVAATGHSAPAFGLGQIRPLNFATVGQSVPHFSVSIPGSVTQLPSTRLSIAINSLRIH